MSLPRRVLIEWFDSHSDSDWLDVSDARRQAADSALGVITTIGFLLSDEPGFVVVTSSYAPSRVPTGDLVGGYWTIPRVAIKKIRRLPE